MITLTREEAQQVLVVLEYPDAFKATTHAQTAALLRTRIAQPEPEPVAWMMLENKLVPMHTAPPQREWQGLTDEEIRKLSDDCAGVRDETEFIRAIEAKLKEKNT